MQLKSHSLYSKGFCILKTMTEPDYTSFESFKRLTPTRAFRIVTLWPNNKRMYGSALNLVLPPEPTKRGNRLYDFQTKNTRYAAYASTSFIRFETTDYAVDESTAFVHMISKHMHHTQSALKRFLESNCKNTEIAEVAEVFEVNQRLGDLDTLVELMDETERTHQRNFIMNPEKKIEEVKKMMKENLLYTVLGVYMFLERYYSPFVRRARESEKDEVMENVFMASPLYLRRMVRESKTNKIRFLTSGVGYRQRYEELYEKFPLELAEHATTITLEPHENKTPFERVNKAHIFELIYSVTPFGAFSKKFESPPFPPCVNMSLRVLYMSLPMQIYPYNLLLESFLIYCVDVISGFFGNLFDFYVDKKMTRQSTISDVLRYPQYPNYYRDDFFYALLTNYVRNVDANDEVILVSRIMEYFQMDFKSVSASIQKNNLLFVTESKCVQQGLPIAAFGDEIPQERIRRKSEPPKDPVTKRRFYDMSIIMGTMDTKMWTFETVFNAFDYFSRTYKVKKNAVFYKDLDTCIESAGTDFFPFTKIGSFWSFSGHNTDAFLEFDARREDIKQTLLFSYIKQDERSVKSIEELPTIEAMRTDYFPSTQLYNLLKPLWDAVSTDEKYIRYFDRTILRSNFKITIPVMQREPLLDFEYRTMTLKEKNLWMGNAKMYKKGLGIRRSNAGIPVSMRPL